MCYSGKKLSNYDILDWSSQGSNAEFQQLVQQTATGATNEEIQLDFPGKLSCKTALG
jgi:hypothetical protein